MRSLLWVCHSHGPPLQPLPYALATSALCSPNLRSVYTSILPADTQAAKDGETWPVNYLVPSNDVLKGCLLSPYCRSTIGSFSHFRSSLPSQQLLSPQASWNIIQRILPPAAQSPSGRSSLSCLTPPANLLRCILLR